MARPPLGTVHDCASLGRASTRAAQARRGGCHAAQRMAGVEPEQGSRLDQDRCDRRSGTPGARRGAGSAIAGSPGAKTRRFATRSSCRRRPASSRAFVRVNVSGEGPRATAKLIRWSRVQLGELSLETQADHRLLTFQVEQHVLHGADDKADQIGRFALELMAAVDGRALPPAPTSKRRATAKKAGPAGKAAGGRTAAAAKSGRPPSPRRPQRSRRVPPQRCRGPPRQPPPIRGPSDGLVSLILETQGSGKPAVSHRAGLPASHCTRSAGPSAIGSRALSPGFSFERTCARGSRAASGSRTAPRSTASTT